jgi:hypothetical protein
MKYSAPTLLFVATTFLVSLTSPAQAQHVVFSDDYESYAAGSNELVTAWASTSTLANYSVTVAASLGVNNSQGLVWQADFNSGWSGTLPTSMDYTGGNPSGNTDPNLNDYTLSLDLSVSQGIAANRLQMRINGWSGQNFTGTASWTGTGAIDTTSATVGSGFHHFSVNLGTFNSSYGGNFDPTAQSYQIQFQLNGWDLNNGGPVTGETMIIDNLQIQAVPEPSTLAMAGLGLAGLMIIHRRKV